MSLTNADHIVSAPGYPVPGLLRTCLLEHSALVPTGRSPRLLGIHFLQLVLPVSRCVPQRIQRQLAPVGKSSLLYRFVIYDLAPQISYHRPNLVLQLLSQTMICPATRCWLFTLHNYFLLSSSKLINFVSVCVILCLLSFFKGKP